MHILVDEFQDTSRDQYDLLRTLTQDWSSGDGRTLFLVGDPMQSIYGFRNAEVGRFSTVRAAGLAGLPLAAAGTAAQFPFGAGAGALVQRSLRARVSRRGRRAPERRASPGQCRRREPSSRASRASIASKARLRAAPKPTAVADLIAELKRTRAGRKHRGAGQRASAPARGSRGARRRAACRSSA